MVPSEIDSVTLGTLSLVLAGNGTKRLKDRRQVPAASNDPAVA